MKSTVEIARRVREVAARRGVSRAHVALAWVAGSANHNIPIVGAAQDGTPGGRRRSAGAATRCRRESVS